MAKSFVSVFKLNGVPILAPMMNDEVRTMMTIYRQRAIEIEKEIQERKKCYRPQKLITHVPTLENSSAHPEDLASKVEDAADCCPLSAQVDDLYSICITPTTAKAIGENEQSLDPQSDLSRTLTSLKIELNSAFVNSGTDSKNPRRRSVEPHHNMDINDVAIAHTTTATTTKTDLPAWQTSTRTVTPTSDECLPWIPLVRSNTYSLEKPNIDLQSFQVLQHTTPIDHSKTGLGKLLMKPSCPAQPQPKKSIDATGTVNPKKGNVSARRSGTTFQNETMRKNESVLEKQKICDQKFRKSRSKRKQSCPTVNDCPAGSEKGSERTFENVTHVLTAHEQRMIELLKRQEEERLLLEKSFREKTKELVALCAKSLTTEDSGMFISNHPVALNKTQELNPAASVSQLSLCDVSYDSCTDTDDAAYQTCQGNGTSEEKVGSSENALNNSLVKPAENRAPINAVNSSLEVTIDVTSDANGNQQFAALLPQRMKQLQQHQAATIINAYARGHLTRRLLRTDEVENIKRTIVNIVCFIVNSRTQQHEKVDDANGASMRRSASKHIAFCLDRLHDIFIKYSPAQRLQMIRRDRYLKRKISIPKHSLSNASS